jgi:hypothetical protein
MAAAAAAGAPPAAADPVDAEEEELREAILGMDMESLNISAGGVARAARRTRACR